MSLFQLGRFSLHSSGESDFKIECDDLTDTDLDCIAYLLAQRVPAFGSVEGVPQGGLRLAAALRKYITAGPLLIVDDVLSTGASMIEQRGDRRAIGAVVFSRGVQLSWVTPLFLMTKSIR